jgi:hypothetical protein
VYELGQPGGYAQFVRATSDTVFLNPDNGKGDSLSVDRCNSPDNGGDGTAGALISFVLQTRWYSGG